MLLLPDDDNDDAHYGCIAAAAAPAIAAIIAHHNISNWCLLLYFAYFGYTDFFFYFTLCSCNSSHFSHSHCAALVVDDVGADVGFVAVRRRFIAQTNGANLPQLPCSRAQLGWLVVALATLLICTSVSAQNFQTTLYYCSGGEFISLVPI